MSLEKLKTYLEEFSYLKSIQALLHWDMETMMPAGAIEDRAKRLSYIQGKIHSHITSKKYVKILDELKGKRLKPLEKKLLKELLWDFGQMNALPLKHVMESSSVQTHATHVWSKAKKSNDWECFRPHLQKLIDLKRREATFYKTKTPYDALIRQHDKEFSTQEIDKLFAELKSGLIKLVKTVETKKTFVEVKDLKGPFDLDAQKKLSLFVAEKFGLSPEFSRLDVSTHPFSINISPRDQRITTRYTTQNLDSLSSTMHEVGHALYELNLPREWEGTPFQEAVSLSVHESQSRFWENVIGRSEAFARYIHPVMEENFPLAMKGIDPKKLFHIFNRSHPGPIRVESPELYYNLHVIIRYEIEEMIFNQGLNADDLPQIWNEKYESYLGLKPKSYAEGILQDSHWAGGAFGYFPTYTLGNMISGSLYQKMKFEIRGFSQKIEHGEFAVIKDYLVEHIHSKGRSVTAHDIVGELSAKDYLNYLKEKFNE